MDTIPFLAVSAHYYIDGRPWVAPFETVRDARRFLQRGYDDPDLGAVALDIRFTAADLDGSTWKNAFDRVLAGRDEYLSWRMEQDSQPRCVIASYQMANGERAVRAFITVAEALNFLPLGAGRDEQLRAAKLTIHITASDVATVKPEALYRWPPQAWDATLDLVLYGRVRNDDYGECVLQRAQRSRSWRGEQNSPAVNEAWAEVA